MTYLLIGAAVANTLCGLFTTMWLAGRLQTLEDKDAARTGRLSEIGLKRMVAKHRQMHGREMP